MCDRASTLLGLRRGCLREPLPALPSPISIIVPVQRPSGGPGKAYTDAEETKQPKTEQRAQRAPDGQDGPTDADVLYELPEDDVFVDLGEGDLSNGDNVLDGLLGRLGGESGREGGAADWGSVTKAA
jgi:hypothetical protein